MPGTGQPRIESFFDDATGTVTYLVYDRVGGAAAVVDPVLDFDPKAGRTATRSADRVIDRARALGLRIEWILETHANADHLSSAQYIRRTLGGKIAIGARIREVQHLFKDVFGLGAEFASDGAQFDHLFGDDETFVIGELRARALFVPGHTPADIAYLVADAVFVGDTLFMPDVGTARADFPGGDARTLYRSIRRLLDLPGATRVFVCHDYPPPARAPLWETTVAEQRERNLHVRDGIDEQEFVDLREARDATLEMPTLILPSIQVNIRAGALPAPEPNGVSYLKIPVDRL